MLFACPRAPEIASSDLSLAILSLAIIHGQGCILLERSPIVHDQSCILLERMTVACWNSRNLNPNHSTYTECSEWLRMGSPAERTISVRGPFIYVHPLVPFSSTIPFFVGSMAVPLKSPVSTSGIDLPLFLIIQSLLCSETSFTRCDCTLRPNLDVISFDSLPSSGHQLIRR